MEESINDEIVNSLLVSIIIAFMNEERFLEEAIQSVLIQDYNNWELILVDDGSSDKSTTIAKQYATDFSDKIKYFEHLDHINKGACASRNLGVEKSKGQLIAILDADDVWLPQKLSNQVKIFEQHSDIGMVIEGSEYWYNWTDNNKYNFEIPVGASVAGLNNWMQWATTTSQIVSLPSKLKLDKTYVGKEIISKLYPFGAGAAPCPSSWMIKKESLLKIGGFEESFTKQFQLYEDQAILLKIYLNEFIYISSASNNRYRQHPESVVKWVKAKGLYHNVRKHFFHWVKAYLIQNQITDFELNKIVKRSMVPYQYPIYYFLIHKLPNYAVKVWRKINLNVFHSSQPKKIKF